MGKRLTAIQLERRQKLAAARELYYKNKPASTVSTVNRRELDAYIYSSYTLVDSTGESERLLVQASTASVTKFGGATALLLVDPASITTTIGKKPKEFKPAMVHAMQAGTAPTASTSPWGSRVLKYSSSTTGNAQGHFSAPISGDLNATAAEVLTRARTVYTAIKGSLGPAEYHRFWYSPEQVNVQMN